jgi:hydrogenase expression/formation protein HypC
MIIMREVWMMCVGISAKVVSVDEGTAVIDASGAKRRISADLIEDLEPGDYVMVHAGMAIAKITDSDTDETNKIMETL